MVISRPLSASSIYYDPWHPPCSIYMPDSLFPQSPSFLWSTCWRGTLHFILHTFLHPIIVFLLCHLILVSLSTLYLELLSSSFTLHIHLTTHLCPLKCHLIFLSYGPGLASMQHTTSQTTAVQSPSHYQWYQLPKFVPSNSISGLYSCISISVYTQHVT